MIADKASNQKWYGNGENNADHGGNDPNGGVATEGKGRERNADLYENDVLGKVAKRRESDIWSRGGYKRKKHKEDD